MNILKLNISELNISELNIFYMLEKYIFPFPIESSLLSILIIYFLLKIIQPIITCFIIIYLYIMYINYKQKNI